MAGGPHAQVVGCADALTLQGHDDVAVVEFAGRRTFGINLGNERTLDLSHSK